MTATANNGATSQNSNPDYNEDSREDNREDNREHQDDADDLSVEELKKRLIKTQDEYKALRGRLAPAQRQAAEYRNKLIQLEQENQELQSFKQAYDELSNEAGDYVLRKQVEQSILDSYTQDELDAMDPIVYKGLVASAVASAKVSDTKARGKAKVEREQSNSSATAAANESDIIRNDYVSDPDSYISKMIANSADSDLRNWIDNDPYVGENLNRFIDSKDPAEVAKAAKVLERRLNEFYGSGQHPRSEAPGKKENVDDVSPPASSGGVARFASRQPRSEAEVRGEISSLQLQATRLARSAKLEDRKKSRDLLVEVDKLIRSLN